LYAARADLSEASSVEARYPMARRGGLFLVLIGAALIAAIALGRDTLVSYPVFFAGLGLAVLSLFVSGRLSDGTPTRAQLLALAVALAVEAVLFALLPRVLPPGTSEHVRWLWVLMIVGVHFLPMAVSFGPLFLLLGGACISNAALGLLLPEVPFGLFGFVDGALKVFVGVGSLRARPARVTPPV
jgi:hypothetical protein